MLRPPAGEEARCFVSSRPLPSCRVVSRELGPSGAADFGTVCLRGSSASGPCWGGSGNEQGLENTQVLLGQDERRSGLGIHLVDLCPVAPATSRGGIVGAQRSSSVGTATPSSDGRLCTLEQSCQDGAAPCFLIIIIIIIIIIIWNTQDTTLIVATRGAISFTLQQNWASNCAIVWPWTRSSLSTAHRRITVRSADAKGTGKGSKCKTKKRLCRSSRLSWQSKSSRTRSKSGSCKRARFGSSSFPKTATWQPRSSHPTKSSEPASRMLPKRSSRTWCRHRLRRGSAYYERRCQRPLFRNKFKQAFGYIEIAPIRATSRRE